MTIRLIVLETDPETGARCVYDILEADDCLSLAHIACAKLRGDWGTLEGRRIVGEVYDREAERITGWQPVRPLDEDGLAAALGFRTVRTAAKHLERLVAAEAALFAAGGPPRVADDTETSCMVGG